MIIYYLESLLLDSSFKVAFFWSSSSCDNDISSGPMVAWLMHRWPNVLSHCCDDSSWQGCISWNRSFAFDQWAMTCNHCAPRSTQTVGLVSKNLFPTCLPFLDASGDWRQGSQGWQCHQCVDFSWPFIANSTLLWFIYSLLNLLDIKTQRCACACYHEALPWTILSVEFIIISFWDSLSFWVIVKLPCLCVHIYIQHRTAASSA